MGAVPSSENDHAGSKLADKLTNESNLIAEMTMEPADWKEYGTSIRSMIIETEQLRLANLELLPDASPSVLGEDYGERCRAMETFLEKKIEATKKRIDVMKKQQDLVVREKEELLAQRPAEPSLLEVVFGWLDRYFQFHQEFYEDTGQSLLF
eukprot:Platyproteum_vivax@DN5211_c0_g1_i1.p1